MRLNQVTLNDFGPFDQRTISFRSGFTVLFGRNEAGKSTLLHAIRAAFFGATSRKIGDKNVRTLDGWLNARPTTSVQVDGELADASALSFLRTNSTKTPVDGTIAARSIDADQLARLLDIDATQFRNIYGFTLEELRAGQQSLTDASVTEVLFGGGLGRLASFRALQKQIDKRAGDLFKSRGKNQPVNALLTAVQETANQLRERTVTPQRYDELTSEISDAELQSSQLEAQLADLRHQLSRLDRLDRVADLVEQRALVRANQQSLGLDTPLSEAGLDTVEQALGRIGDLEPQIEDAERSLDRIEDQLAALSEHPSLAAVGSAIDDFASQLPLVAEARRRVRETEVELGEVEQQLASQEHDFEITSSALPADAALRLDDWEQRFASLRDSHREQTADLARTRRDLSELERLIELSDDPVRESAILSAAATIAGVQSSQSHRETLRRQYDLRRNQLEQRGSKLAAAIGWNQWPNDRSQLPSSAAVDEAVSLFMRLQSRRDEVSQEIRQLEKERQRLADDLDLLRSNPDIASVTQLQEARTKRDELAALLRKEIAEDRFDQDQLVGLSDQLMRADATVDDLADRIIANSREAARIAEVEKKLAYVQRDADTAAHSLQDIDCRLTEWHDEWKALWQEVTDDPLSPVQTQQWLEQIVAYEDDLFRLESDSVELAQLDAEWESAEQQLIKTVPEELTSADRSVMLTWLEKEAEAVRDKRGERRRAEQTRPTLLTTAEDQQLALDKTTEEIELLDAEFNAWKSEHGLAEVDTLDELRLRLDADSSSRQLRQQRQSAQERLKQAKRLVEHFEEGVNAVRQRLKESESDLANADWVALAQEQLTEHREVSVRKKSLIEKRREISSRLAELNSEFENAVKKVASIVVDFEPNTLEQTRLLVTKSNDYWAADVECRRLNELIVAVVDVGQSSGNEADQLESVIAELASMNAAARNEQRASLQRTFDQLQSDLKTAQSRVAVLQQEHGSLSRGERLAELQVQLESERAKLRDAVDQYAPLVLLQSMLDRAIDAFSRTVRPELLDRVCDLFCKLTAGDYVAVERRLDAESLRVQTADGRWKVPGQLSTGTRELLYLAVRIAFIQERHQSHEPLPLIIDDVLVNIDAVRSRAVLDTLAQLANETQVVLLTCRPELVLLLQSLGYGDAVHEMTEHDLDTSLGVLQPASATSAAVTLPPQVSGGDDGPRESSQGTEAAPGVSGDLSKPADKKRNRRNHANAQDADQPDLFATNAES